MQISAMKSSGWLERLILDAPFAELDASTDGCVFGSGAVLPPAARILQWLEALIDTHFIALAMSQASLQASILPCLKALANGEDFLPKSKSNSGST